jgi:hypothetical protein
MAIALRPRITIAGHQRIRGRVEELFIGSALPTQSPGRRAPNQSWFARSFPYDELTQGGYSNNIVVSEGFAIKIPENAEIEKVAPLFCACIFAD